MPLGPRSPHWGLTRLADVVGTASRFRANLLTSAKRGELRPAFPTVSQLSLAWLLRDATKRHPWYHRDRAESRPPKGIQRPMRNLAPALPYILHLLPPAAASVGGSPTSSGSHPASSSPPPSSASGARVASSRASSSAVSICSSPSQRPPSRLLPGAGRGLQPRVLRSRQREKLALASVTLRPVLVGVVAYLVVALACPMLLGRGCTSRRGSWGLVAAGVAGLALCAPAWSFACTWAGGGGGSSRAVGAEGRG